MSYLYGFIIFWEESDDELSDEDESDEEEEIAHSAPFKCIGAAHEKNY